MNDERPIEKLLRRYANKRRDEAGAPPELHPATRRLLQGEVVRQFPKSAPESKPSAADFFAQFARRWAYAVGLFVVLGITALMLLPTLSKSKSLTLLAQKTASEETLLRESIPPVAAPVLAPAIPPAEAQPAPAVAESRRNQPLPEPGGGGNNLRLRNESTTLSYSATNGVAVGALARFADAKADTEAPLKAEEAKPVSLGMLLDSATPATRGLTIQPPSRVAGEAKSLDSLALEGNAAAGRADTGVATDGLAGIRQTATPPPATVAAASGPSASLSDKTVVARGGGVEKDAGQSYSQSFANVASEQLTAKAAKVKAESPVTPVLASFQIQQSGNELRVIDSDGSTYVGAANVVSDSFGGSGAAGKEVAAASFENSARRQTPALAGAVTANQQQMQNYQWRAEGTNRTLNQNVVFTWNFIETNALAGANLNYDAAGRKLDAAKLPSQFPAQLQNSLINGRAQFGPGKEIEVNAVPVRP